MLNKRDNILHRICLSPGISRRELMRCFSWNIRTVNSYVSLLENQGFIEGRLVSQKSGRPCMRYFPCSSPLVFGCITFDQQGLHGFIHDSLGKFLVRQDISEFALSMEIPETLFHKTDYFVKNLENYLSRKIHALTIIFPNGMENSPLATGLRDLLNQHWTRPFFIQSPLAVHADNFKLQYPQYRKILCLHFGFDLELILMNDEGIDSENHNITASIKKWHNLHHEVSLSTICDRIAAMHGNCFYPFSDIIRAMNSQNPEILQLLLEKEEQILKALDHMTEVFHPDAVFLLMLPSDQHLAHMPNLLSLRTIGSSGTSCHVINCSEKQSLPLMKAGSAATEYLSWRKFFK